MPAKPDTFTVKSIAKLGNGKYQDPETRGLWLVVRGDSRTWLFRWSQHHKAHSLGLGSIGKGVGLAAARVKARQARAVLDAGGDPSKRPEPAKPTHSFRQDVLKFYEREHRAWDAVYQIQWMQGMERHMLPKLGSMDEVTASDIVGVIDPVIDSLWRKQHETAIRLLGRVRGVVDFAMNCDETRYQRGNPVPRALAQLPVGFHKPATPHRALPWQDAPRLYQQLCGLGEDTAARALRFMLLTCTPRCAEVIGARWSEIDRRDGPTGDCWHLPAARMKSGVARDVPLSRAALELLDAIRPADATGFIFPASRKGKTIDGTYYPFHGHIADDAMGVLLRILGAETTAHGLRACVRSWVSAHAISVVDHDAAELALDHTIGNRVARAYDREDLLVARRDLAERWALYLGA